MPIGLEVTLSNISAFLLGIAPTISIILIVLGGIIYGLSYTQPPDSRGKWQTSGMSMALGGLIVGAIAGAATIIQETSAGLLK
ncbi:hypothetical protein H0O02_00615 [Candidatus Micrarchaeota archaeon]|nr:hypothetical protein [Candidatus Micrarchaeota archaeon]